MLALRVKSKVNGRIIVTLIDSGSNHKFVDAKLVTFLGLKVFPLQNFQVSAANDNTMECKGMIKGVKLQLDNYELSSNFYVAALAGC